MSCLVRQFKPIEYMSHLYKSDLDGYVQIMHIRHGKVKCKNFKRITLRQAIANYQSLEDIFITPNTTYNGKRLVSNIR